MHPGSDPSDDVLPSLASHFFSELCLAPLQSVLTMQLSFKERESNYFRTFL